jgi:glutamyl-tRNA reductase
VVNSNLRERMKEAERAESMVAEEVERMMARLKVAEVTPTIVGLQEQLEQIRAAEIDKMRRKCGPLHAANGAGHRGHDPAIVNKVAHGPISEIAQPRRPPRGRPRGGGLPSARRFTSPPGGACYSLPIRIFA